MADSVALSDDADDRPFGRAESAPFHSFQEITYDVSTGIEAVRFLTSGARRFRSLRASSVPRRPELPPLFRPTAIHAKPSPRSRKCSLSSSIS